MPTIATGCPVLSAALLSLVIAGGSAACSSSNAGNTSSGGTYTIWDPYPQYDNSSA